MKLNRIWPARPLHQSIAGNVGWLAAERILRMVAGLLIGVWIARYLGPAQYGELSYVIAYVAGFQIVLALGLDNLIVRNLASRRDDAAAVLGTAFRLRMSAALGCVVLACVCMALVRPHDTRALLMTMLVASCMLFQPADIVDLWFIAETRSRHAAVARIIALSVASAMKIGLLLTRQPLWTFATTQVIEAIIAATLLAGTYRRHPVGRLWIWDPVMARTLLREGWPVLLSGLSILVYMRIDQIVLRNLAGEAQLGLYSAVLPFSQAWSFIPTTICASVAPHIVRLHARSTAEFERRMQQLMFVLAWLSVSVVVAVALAAQPIVELLLGPAYSGAARVLTIHAFTNLAVFSGVAQMIYLTTVGRTGVVLLQTSIGAVVSLSANLLMVPKLGAVGAALAAVAAYTTSAILVNFFAARRLFWLQLRAFWPPDA